MSKESYVRGFCKAASAAGVDPEALAKYAQDTNAVKGVSMPLYKTDGWAPAVVSLLGTEKAIKYYPPDIKHPYEWARILSDSEAHDFSDGNADHPSRFRIMPLQVFDPIYAWIKAHQKARVAASMAPLGDSGKIYHDSMAKSTGGVSRVSAPAKK